jgi:hypothetical protein
LQTIGRRIPGSNSIEFRNTYTIYTADQYSDTGVYTMKFGLRRQSSRKRASNIIRIQDTDEEIQWDILEGLCFGELTAKVVEPFERRMNSGYTHPSRSEVFDRPPFGERGSTRRGDGARGGENSDNPSAPRTSSRKALPEPLAWAE